MSTYLVYDLETTYGKSHGRVGNRWDKEFGLCSNGWKYGDADYNAIYTVHDIGGIRMGMRPCHGLPFPDLSRVSLLVGHNIKFDLLWYWDHPEIIAFLKRGGKIWDTMYAEYLLSGQLYNQHAKGKYAINLKDTAIRRNCKYAKQDVVKALWDSGIRTEDIKEEVLMEYMKYDVLTTEEVFLQQVKQARKQGQVKQIQNSMDGLLGTTEMEFNGMKIDYDLAMGQKAKMEVILERLNEELAGYIPELPTGCEFKWTSWRHLSALLFGGDIKYVGREDVLDEAGEKTYYLTKKLETLLDGAGNPLKFKSGKRAGKIKTKQVTVPDFGRGAKQRNAEFRYSLPGLTDPNPEWAAKSAPGYYSTAVDIIDALEDRDIPFIASLLEFRKLEKNLGTYYIREKKGKTTGMLTNIQPSDGCVHGSLNHSVTVTRRLSGSEPNLQNLDKKGDIKKTFISRFKDGVVAELDYGQLEVVCKGVLSGDEVLLQALIDKVCFHCDWLSLATGVPYGEVYQKAKVDKIDEWVAKRQAIKSGLTFSESYGAGVATMAKKTGLDADLIANAIEARKRKYPRMYAFNDEVEAEVRASRALTTQRTDDGYQKAVGYYTGPTKTIFHFLESASLPWQRAKGVMTTFSPTCMKNYPSQGLGGEVMQVMFGLVFRELIQRELRDDIKMMLTVHDSVYFDFRTEELALEYLPKIAALLEDVCFFFNYSFEDCNWDTPFPIDADYGLNIKEVGRKPKEVLGTGEVRGTVTDRGYEWVNSMRATCV